MAFTKINAAGIGTTETVTVDGLTVINDGSFGGNLSVGGTLTYEDVTNVDSVGLITARNGIVVGSGITLSKDGNIFATGISTLGGDIQMSGDNPEFEMNAGGPRFRVPSSNTLSIFTSGGLGSTSDERVRLDSSGRLLLGTTTEGHSSADDLTIATSGSTGITIRTGTTNQGNIYFADGTSGASEYAGLISYNHNTNHMFFGTDDGTERVRITSGGAVGINETSPSAMLHVENDNANASTYYLNSDATVLFQNKNSSATAKTVLKLEGPAGGGDCAFVYGDSSANLIFSDRENERLRITDDGNMGFGTNGDPMDFVEFKNSTAQKKLVLSKSNSGTADQNGMWLQFNNYGPSGTARADGTIIGKLHFYASQPTSGNLQDAAAIECRADGAQTGNNTHSRLAFFTTSSQTATERMTIDGDGRVIIGSSTHIGGGQLVLMGGNINSYGAFAIGNKVTNPSSGTFASFRFNSGATGTRRGAEINAVIDGSWTDGSSHPSRLQFHTTSSGATSATERLRIDQAGNLFFGGTSDPHSNNGGTSALVKFNYGTIAANYAIEACSDSIVGIFNKTQGNGVAIEIKKDATVVGSITVSGSNTAYNTSSDYRLKENIVNITDGITRVKQLIPRRFNWIGGSLILQDGFLAHEVQSVVPESVQGEKDEIAGANYVGHSGISEGDPVYQEMDHSKLVPLLTAALQEEIAKREALEARLDAAGL